MILTLLTATAITLSTLSLGANSVQNISTGAEVSISTSLEEKVMYARTTVNIRKEPNTEAEIIDKLYFGDDVIVINELNDWFVVRYNGGYAYVSNSYLTDTEPVLKTHIKKEYVKYAKQIAKQFDNMDAALIVAIIEVESDGNTYCHSKTDDRGLMQVTPKWYKAEMALYGVDDLYEPRGNIQVGTHIISGLISKYGDVRTALMCYNEGEYGGAPQRAARGRFSKYAQKIFKRAEELRQN